MTASPHDYRQALDVAHAHALDWLDSLATRPVSPRATADELHPRFSTPLQDGPLAPHDVVQELAELAEPGLMSIGSGRFFGWVMGGVLPAALAADWLVSAWDQNNGLRYATPAAAAIEQAAGGWLLDILGLPPASAVGFTTGATMANWVGLAAARHHVLTEAGWDLAANGLIGAPPLRVFVGRERHSAVELAIRYLGLPTPIAVEADDQGRIIPAALQAALDAHDGPAIVCLQAGNLHSGAFDPIGEAAAIAHAHGAWAHVDGAFGLWAAASPRFRDEVAGWDTCDSWATDAHKTLNVPYDCGVAIVARPEAVRAALGIQTSYFITDNALPDPFDLVPELSRRARGIPVWAALRSLGRDGVATLVDGLVDHAQELARGLAAMEGVEVLNDVVFTQVSVSFGSDDRTRAITSRVIGDGTSWMSGSHWADRDILRISVSNWATDAADVAASLDAVERAIAAEDATTVPAGQRAP